MIGWMDNWQYASKLPTSGWRGQMTLPRKLALRQTAQGIRLFQAPVDELQKLAVSQTSISGGATLSKGHSYQLQSKLDLGTANEAGWKILADGSNYTLVGYDKAKGVVYVDRTHSGKAEISKDFPSRIEAPLKLSGPLSLDIVVDRLSLELFANQGAVTMTDLVFPNSGADKIEFYAKGGKAGALSAQLTEFKSAY
jgi:sucrose-6-phosphate hydrolase SacC (GH32 family)